MTDSRPVMEQYNKLLGILGRFTQHKMNMDEVIQVFCVIDKLSPSWKDFKHTLKHKKEESILVELGSHLRIEESLRVQDSDEPKGNNVVDPSVVNMMEHNNFQPGNNDKNNGSVYYVTYVSEAFFMQDDDVALWVDSGATIHVCKDKMLALLCLFITKDEALDKFKVFKTEVELQQVPLIKRFRTDRGGKYVSGLGLLLSPSSSTGNDSEDIVGSTIESPGCVLRVRCQKLKQRQVFHDNWVACDRCNAWRLLPIGITADNLPENWWCSKSTWLLEKELLLMSVRMKPHSAVREMNFNKFQNNVIGDTQKRKRLSEANQQLLEKNVVNKPIDVGRNDATVNGEPRPKKLKTKTGLDQHDHLTSTKIKNENERQAENTRASSKSKLLDRKSCEEVEMPAKKRKLKDQQDTLPYTNTVKEKRLKTSNTDINGEEKPLIKGNGMKIKLSFGATSSSSKVSCRRASLQEIKGSPVGSVSSSPLKAFNLDKLSPAAAGRTISRKAHAKSSIGPEVPRKLLAR
ncbi:cullin, conserved site-containing protein, partial [Tanacetum coccineum]